MALLANPKEEKLSCVFHVYVAMSFVLIKFSDFGLAYQR